MENNKNNNNSSTNNNSVNKNDEKAKLIDQVKEKEFQFGATQSDDINQNLGSFTKTVNNQNASSNEQQIDLEEIDKTVVDKASNEKINFERFSKTQKGNRKAKTKLGEKVSIALRDRKKLRYIWILEIVFTIIFAVLSALIVAKLWPISKYDSSGPIYAKNLVSLTKASAIFCWIAIFPCFIPFIYFITAWFIGINQLSSSKIFHYVFWICLLISFICLIVGLNMSVYPLLQIWQYPNY